MIPIFCLDNTDLIQGDADNATEVDFTIHGLVGTAFTQLAAGQLANAKGTLYTAGAAVSVVSIILVNTGAAAQAVNLYIDPDAGGNSRRLIPKDVLLGIGYSLHTDGQRISIMDTTGGIAYSYIAHTHDGDTLLLDGINSNGGAFAFTTTGAVTHNQNVIIPDGGNLGSVSDPDAIAIADDGNLTFSGQSGFSGFLSADLDLAPADYRLVEFDSEEDDIQGEFNVGTYTFTAADTGKYQVSASVAFIEALGDTNVFAVYLYKNAAVYTTGIMLRQGAAGQAAGTVAARVPLTANDTLSIYIYFAYGENRQVDSNLSRFSVARVA